MEKRIKRRLGALAILGILVMVSLIPMVLATPKWGEDPNDINDTGSYYIDIDSNNDDEDQAFAVTKHGLSGVGTELFRVQEDGNVGIGTQNPQAKLHVMSYEDQIRVSYPGGMPYMNLMAGGAWCGIEVHYSYDNLFSIWDGDWETGEVRLNIKEDGRVGIGKLEPATELDVDGVITATGGNSDNWNTAYQWGDHALAGYLTSESDPIFGASAASGITSGDITNWDTAYGWGDHALAGYLTSESDPIFGASAASGITSGDITNWDTAYSWGDHALAGYDPSSTNELQSLADAYAFGGPSGNSIQLTQISGSIHIFNDDPINKPILWLDERTGNVGMGTTAPSAKLDVEIPQNPTGLDGAAEIGINNLATGYCAIAMGQSSTASGMGSIAIGSSLTAGGSFSIALGKSILIEPSATDSIGIGLNFDPTPPILTQPHTMAIMNGNVGIGTTTPTESLEVNGNIKLSGDITSDGEICIGSGCP
ncbi:MAG: hypothetical protein JSV09_01870 [Thermoplasmata archaeon]|nr:MAG: hypothetical protein JSV09_01870 [Thermoplasmata archaeon]